LEYLKLKLRLKSLDKFILFVNKKYGAKPTYLLGVKGLFKRRYNFFLLRYFFFGQKNTFAGKY
jgi:hypothetical protein